MSRRKKKRDRVSGSESSSRSKIPADNPWSGESRAVDMLTVGWLISTFVTLLAILGWVVLKIYIRLNSGPAIEEGFVARLHILMLYVVLVLMASGSITLVLTAVTNRLRIKPAPREILYFSLITGIVSCVLATWTWSNP
jgi:hypothetical protein